MVIGSRSIDFGSAAYLKNDGGTIHFMSDWDAHSNKWKIILKSRSKAMGLYDDLKPTISGFSVINGNLLVIATGDNQLYRYPLTRDGIMSSKVKRAELIGCHQYGMDDLCFYSYSNTLRPCGDGAVPFPQQ
ncbi:hypothetical protein AgCh_023034 [Apium graveolens]